MAYIIIATLLLAPAYAVRFSFLGFPTNLLMAWGAVVWIVSTGYLLANKKTGDFVRFFRNADKKIMLLAGLFFAAGIVSLFAHGFSAKKLGQFIVLFLEPISIFFIVGYIFHADGNRTEGASIAPFAPSRPNAAERRDSPAPPRMHPSSVGMTMLSGVTPSKDLLLTAIYLLLAAMGLYALIQYVTLLGLPAMYWGNNEEPKRAVAFFSHPNFYALFSAPLLAFLLPDLEARIKDKGLKIKDWYPLAWLLGVIGLFLSLSRAGWIGLAAAIGVYIIVAADKKFRRIILSAVIIVAIATISVPNLRYRVILPFLGEKSAVSRISLWRTGWKGIAESPVTGLGLAGFSQNWKRLNTDPGLTDTHNFPHNIFLDTWVETGLLGLISFIWLIGLLIYRGIKSGVSLRANASGHGNLSHNKIASDALAMTQRTFQLSVALFIICLLVQGQIDNPYFKNDLAMVFWIILAMIV